MIVKILAIIFPVILFVFKYILPSIAEAVYNNTKREKKQIIIELMHFPVDLLFVAISYTVPKIIETTASLADLAIIDQNSIDSYKSLVIHIAIYCGESVIMLMALPFIVFFTKTVEKNYFKQNKSWIKLLIFLYLVSIVSIFISLFV